MRSTPKACGGRQAFAEQTPRAYESETVALPRYSAELDAERRRVHGCTEGAA